MISLIGGSVGPPSPPWPYLENCPLQVFSHVGFTIIRRVVVAALTVCNVFAQICFCGSNAIFFSCSLKIGTIIVCIPVVPADPIKIMLVAVCTYNKTQTLTQTVLQSN